MYNIEFYEDRNGLSDTYEYIKKLIEKPTKENMQKLKKIDMYLTLLSKHGLMLGEPYIKKINNKIWELRPLRDRFLFIYCKDNKFLILNYFTKKTQKTPKMEIKKAERLIKDYEKRGNIV